MGYATLEADFARLGLPVGALAGLDPDLVREALESASDVADGSLRQRYALPLLWEFLPLAARSASGQGSAIDLTAAADLKLALDVTAVSGNGASVVVTLETSADGSTGWTAAGSYAAQKTPGRQVLRASKLVLQRYVRLSWVLSGAAPSLAFGVTWEGADLKSAVCRMAAYDVLSVRGFAPEPGSPDEQVRLRYQDALTWLKQVASGLLDPGFLDATPAIEEGGAVMVTEPRRGW